MNQITERINKDLKLVIERLSKQVNLTIAKRSAIRYNFSFDTQTVEKLKALRMYSGYTYNEIINTLVNTLSPGDCLDYKSCPYTKPTIQRFWKISKYAKQRLENIANSLNLPISYVVKLLLYLYEHKQKVLNMKRNLAYKELHNIISPLFDKYKNIADDNINIWYLLKKLTIKLKVKCQDF